MDARDSRVSNTLRHSAEDKMYPTKKERNYRDAAEVLNALVEDMKIQDKANTTRHLDLPRLDLRNRLNAEICETQMEKDIRQKGDVLEKYFNERRRNMDNLLDTAKDLLENIRIENEMNEHKRRKLEMRRHEDLSSKIESVKIQTLAEFDNIIAKWTELNEVEDTFDLYEKFESQKQQIANIMDSKQKMIELCQQEALRMNDEYFDNIKQQNANSILLIQRIKASVELTNKVNAQALDDVADMLYEEEIRYREESMDKWDNLMEYVNQEDKKIHDILAKKFISYGEKIKETIKEHEHMTRVNRRQLDDQFDEMQLDLEQQHYSMFMNSEKLDYNLQIVSKRKLEQLHLVNQQKRSIARVKEHITRAKQRYAAAEKAGNMKTEKLKKQIKKKQESIYHQHEKLYNLRWANKCTFDNMWDMITDDAVKICQNILAVEKTLCEQLLGRDYEEPDIYLKRITTKYTKKDNELKRKAALEKLQSSNIFMKKRLYTRFARKVLQQIGNGAGVLVEQKVLDILAPHVEKHSTLVRIEHIFKALHISNDVLLQDLIDYFKSYSWCPNCSSGLSDEVIKQLMEEKEENSKNYVVPRNEACNDHHFVTEQAFVLTILNKYLKKFLVKPPEKMILDDILEQTPITIPQDEKDIEDFFNQFLTMFPLDQEGYWHFFAHCLCHYLDILRKREALNIECEELYKQNKELKYLLQKFS